MDALLKLGKADPAAKRAKHWFNHLLFSPDGRRFIFLHRWRSRRGFSTRMLTATPEGQEVRVVDPSGCTSHFIWRDAGHILAWTRPAGKPWGFYLLEDRTGRARQVGKGAMRVNGHCSYLPGAKWILNDTYPSGRRREQNVYLYHVASARKVDLGLFPSPRRYRGEWRCDTHPRFSRDGKTVCIDSAHAPHGRQLYLIDISRIVGK